ncbi:MAG TPA: hypothetical protein VM925_14980 [Labilithrix sp.]|nr:hypothetical protein [Labilithrix sp.]
MRPRSLRFVFAAASILASSAVATPASAGGAVLSPVGESDPSFVDVRMAVAATPGGSTRWTELTLPAGARVAWLVPVKPGAAVDWAPDGWLDALDDATRVRLAPPSETFDCPARLPSQTSAPWSKTGARKQATSLAVQASADALLAYAAERGYAVPPALADEIAAVYQRGWRLLTLELATGRSTTSTGTLRVSDDAGAVFPLALWKGARITAFAIGPGAATLPGSRDVDAGSLRWGSHGSSYETWRREVIEGGPATWLRESSSHDVLFSETPVPGGPPIPSVAAGYFANASCTTRAEALRSSSGVVGTSCAPGEVARVPGGAECTPSSGSIDPSTLTCFDRTDFSLSLSAGTPRSAFVTRWATSIPEGRFGSDLPISFAPDAQRGPVFLVHSLEACPPEGTDAPLSPPPISRPSGGDAPSGTSSHDEASEYGTPSESCSGSTTSGTVAYEEEPPPEETSESCSGSDTSSDDGWDDSDSGDGCSSDDSSSSSSDACSRGSSSSSSGGGDEWDTEDDEDGWDTEDEASPSGAKIRPSARKKPHASGKTKKKPGSPVSRYSLLAAALLLPLRRRGRAEL